MLDSDFSELDPPETVVAILTDGTGITNTENVAVSLTLN
mgnify:CR=1 FL=1